MSRLLGGGGGGVITVTHVQGMCMIKSINTTVQICYNYTDKNLHNAGNYANTVTYTCKVICWLMVQA